MAPWKAADSGMAPGKAADSDGAADSNGAWEGGRLGWCPGMWPSSLADLDGRLGCRPRTERHIRPRARATCYAAAEAGAVWNRLHRREKSQTTSFALVYNDQCAVAAPPPPSLPRAGGGGAPRGGDSDWDGGGGKRDLQRVPWGRPHNVRRSRLFGEPRPNQQAGVEAPVGPSHPPAVSRCRLRPGPAYGRGSAGGEARAG